MAINFLNLKPVSLALAACLLIASAPAQASILGMIAAGVAVHALDKRLEKSPVEKHSDPKDANNNGQVGHVSDGKMSSSEVNASLPAMDGSFKACANFFPRNIPLRMDTINNGWKPRALCFSDFAVLYSGLSKTPMVTVELLNSAKLSDAKDEKRTDNFFMDDRLAASERAALADYRGSRYDRGHMAPAGDRPTELAMNQSFSLSNMIPQDPTNNRKIWAKIESDVRKFGRRAKGNVYVFSGPIFTSVAGHQETIGQNQVWVPEQMFKLVYDEASGRSWAYILDNTSTATINTPIEYNQFVAKTGWKLLPN